MHIVVAQHDPTSSRHWRDAIARSLPEAVVEVWDQERGGSPAKYAIGWLPPPAPFFEQHRQLQAFFCTAAGVEKILASPTLPADLPLVRLEDAGMGAQMSDYCIYEVLRWLRHREQYADQRRARVWKQLSIDDPAGWPVGVFGLGVLGRHVAAAFAALGFRVSGYSRSPQALANVSSYADAGGAGDFAAFMRASRVLIILAPLTAATRNRFDRAALALLPRGAYVINVARGDLLVDDALIELLDDGHLAGAALDVFREEPLPAKHPFWSHPKVSITPHISAITVTEPSARQIAEKIRRLERGEPIGGVVDRVQGY
jgi:glyoxylate/hydroxypyruvate reductase A